MAIIRLTAAVTGSLSLLSGSLARAQTTQSVTLAWNPSPSSGIAGYRLHYGTSSGTHPNIINVGNVTTATVSSLTAGQTYYFVATAYNTVGHESPPSNEVSFTAAANAPVWHHIDISVLATAPPAAGDPSGYVLGGGEFVVYRGTENHVHRLFAVANQGPWSHADLTAITNAPLAIGNPFGYVNGGKQFMAYRGTDNHIHQLSNNGTQWVQTDLSTSAHVPATAAAAGDPFECNAPSGRPVIDYNGMDGHIHGIRMNGSGLWATTDMTALTSAPLSAGDPMEYLKGSTQIVPFRAGTDIHAVYTINNNSAWAQTDISASAHAPAAAGDPTGYILGNQYIDYRGTDNHIHQLFVPSTQWATADLTILTGAPPVTGDPFGYVLGGSTALVVYKDASNDIDELFGSGTQWGFTDMSKAAGAPGSAAGAPFAYTFGNQAVVYRGTNGDIHLLYLQ